MRLLPYSSPQNPAIRGVGYQIQRQRGGIGSSTQSSRGSLTGGKTKSPGTELILFNFVVLVQRDVLLSS